VKSFSSFQKRSANKNTIAGTRPSLSNNQLLISTGNPSLDNVLGVSFRVIRCHCGLERPHRPVRGAKRL